MGKPKINFSPCFKNNLNKKKKVKKALKKLIKVK